MRKVIIAVLLCVFLSSVKAQTVSSEWVPTGWKKLAVGKITSVYNATAYTEDSFNLKIASAYGECANITFRIDAPLSSEKTVERAYQQALLYQITGQSVAIHGIGQLY